jgi:tryptophanyl-tRNA synthetase
MRFNAAYRTVFTIPEITTPPDVVRRKVARAVTDSETTSVAVRSDRAAKPGVTHLLEILTACGGDPAGLATYGALKKAVTDAVVAELEPLQKRYADLAADPAHVTEVHAAGAARCRDVTAPVLAAAGAAIGL